MLMLLVLRWLQSAQFNNLQLNFSFSEVFALKQVWEMTIFRSIVCSSPSFDWNRKKL